MTKTVEQQSIQVFRKFSILIENQSRIKKNEQKAGGIQNSRRYAKIIGSQTFETANLR